MMALLHTIPKQAFQKPSSNEKTTGLCAESQGAYFEGD
jgi:hypothetical protein